MASTLMQIDRSTRAQQLASRALQIWERLNAPDAPEYATALALYAEMQEFRGDHVAAKDYYERAIRSGRECWARRIRCTPRHKRG